MTERTLARARAGDEDAFRELTDPYQRELQLHIYRIVGSTQDAEDLLQETLLAAWRGLEQFEGRASLRAWLYRIATNRSLDALRASRRRPEDQRMTQMPEPTRWNEPLWLQYRWAPPQAPGPSTNVAQAYAHFARDYREGTHLCPTFEDAVTRHRMLDAIETAAATGKRQRLG